MSFFGKKKKAAAAEPASPPTVTAAQQNGPSNTAPPAPRPLQPLNRLGEPNGLNGSVSSPPMQQAVNGHVGAPPGANSSPQIPPSHTVVFPWSRREMDLLPISSAADLTDSAPGEVSPPPFPRYGHSANALSAAANGDIFVFGGLVDGQQKLSNSLYVLHSVPNRPDNATGAPPGSLSIGLIETKGEVPPPRFGHASVGVGNVLIVWGGDTKISEEDETKDNALYLLNLSTREWTRVEVSGSAPECRYGHSAAMVGSKFYIFGGQHADSRFLGDLWAFDLQKLKAGLASWSMIEANGQIPPFRTGHTCVTHGDCLYIFGGTDGQYHYNDTWQYDTTTKTWKELLCIGYIPVPREGHSATLVDDVMYVFGGRGVDGKDLEDLAAFKISNQRWYMFQNMGPAPSGRSGHAMATWQNKVFVLGGESFPPRDDAHHEYVHVLDTGKIKYPQVSNRQSQARKSQAADAPQAPAPQAQRAASPIQRPPQQPQSLTQAAIETTARAPPVATVALPSAILASNNAAPKRPARPSEDMSSSRMPGESVLVFNRDSTRSPTQEPAAVMQRSMSPPLSRPPAQVTPPAEVAPPAPAEAGPSTGGRARAASVVDRMRSPTPTSEAAKVMVNGPSAPGRLEQPRAAPPVNKVIEAPVVSTKPDPSADWLRAQLAQAGARGYVVTSEGGLDDQSELDAMQALIAKLGTTEHGKVVQAMVGLKQELARIKAVIARQAANADAQIGQATQGRTVALQDAIASRAKLAAHEKGMVDASLTVSENERMSQLERELADALRSRSELETRFEQLEAELTHERTARTSAESRAIAASQRAEATETSYSRSLKDYADMQRRVQHHDTAISGHLEQISSLSTALQKAQADHAHVKARLDSSDTSLDQYLRTLEQTQATLTAANAQADEMQALWVQAKTEATHAQAELVELRSSLDAAKHEASTATARSEELQRVLDTTRAEHNAMRALTSSGLAELVAASKAKNVRGSRDLTDAHAQQLRASQSEVQSVKQLAQDARSRHEETLAELSDHRTRADTFEQQVISLRAEAANARAQHAAALDEAARAKFALAQREADLRETSHQLDSTSATLSMAQSVLADHGLAEHVAQRSASPSLDGLTQDQLIRRVRDLEARLEAFSRSQQALEAAHDATSRDLRNAEQQVRDGARQRQAHADQLDDLQGELQRARSPAPSDSGSNANGRAIKAEADLADLQAKHRGLEASHQKAVQYVKGTEKMLRRMKDELTKHKTRVEELEGQLSARDANNASPADLDALRAELSELRKYSEQASSENEALNARIATLQNNYERTLDEKEQEHRRRTSELERIVHELETQVAPSTPQLNGGSMVNGDFGHLQRELAASQSKTAWALQERESLEAKLSDANGKISLLLDAMERSGAASSMSGHDASSSIDHGSYAGECADRHHYDALDLNVAHSFFDGHRRLSNGSALSEELRPEILHGKH